MVKKFLNSNAGLKKELSIVTDNKNVFKRLQIDIKITKRMKTQYST